jgi:hypothetical protein
MGKSVATYVLSLTYVAGLGMNYDGTLGEYCGLFTLTAEREHHEHCYIARKKSALTESVVRFYIDIQAYSSWISKKSCRALFGTGQIMQILWHVQPLQEGVGNKKMSGNCWKGMLHNMF